jgi:hypothetical protein
MHPKVYQHFRGIVSAINPRGRCLEVGAVPARQTLLAMDDVRHRNGSASTFKAASFSIFKSCVAMGTT